MRFAWAVAAAATLAGTACSGGGGPKPGPDETTVTVIAGSAVLETPGGTADIADSQPLESGSTLRVSGDGAIVEIAWTDGSFTRLGDGSEFTTGDGNPGGTLVSGMAWNRVAPQSTGDFAIDTPQGALTARGTAFLVDCLATCAVSVVEGTVSAPDGATAGALESAALADGAFGEVEPLPWDGIFGDPFALENARLDADAGYPSPTDLYAGADPGFASLAGSYSGTQSFTDARCSGPDAQCSEVLAVEGTARDRTYTFDIDCSLGPPCAGITVTQFETLGQGQVLDDTVTLDFDGETYAWSYFGPTSGPWCQDTGGAAYGRQVNELSWTLTPTAAEMVGGVYRVTRATGTSTSGLKMTGDDVPDSCDSFRVEWEILGELDVESDA